MDQLFALVSGQTFDYVAQTAVRRPQCSACGYEAPLPTLRQFDGLCLGCYEEAEGWMDDVDQAELMSDADEHAEMAEDYHNWAVANGLTADDDYWPSMDDCRKLAN
jgi:hypothetical protein